MKKVPREQAVHYEFGPDMEPAITVQPGERFEVETWDARHGRMFESGERSIPSSDLPEVEQVPPGTKTNPVAGPIFVENAEPGDLLAIHIEEIVPGEKGWSGTKSDMGILHDSATWPECGVDYGHIIDHQVGDSGTTADGVGVFEINGKSWEWQLTPHIGTIATAPAKGTHDTGVSQGPWGGNLDVRDVAAGNTILMNVFSEGGLLFLGDAHGSQGDSELTFLANETCADVTLMIDVLKNESVPGVFRIERDDAIVQVDSAKHAGSIQNALDACFVHMIEWLVEEYDFEAREAYMHMSINPDVRVNVYQFVSGAGYFVCGVEFPKHSLH